MKIIPLKRPAGSQPSGYKVVARGKKEAEVYLYGVIGASMWDDGISADQIRKDLKGLGGVETIHLRINSEGGDVFDGKAIYTLFQQHKAKVVAHIDGLAASAASYIAMAADEVEISESAFVMIHNAHTIAMGGAADLRQTADLLEQVDGTIRDVYVARTGQSAEKIEKWMRDETWFTGKEAVEHKFADRMVGNMRVAASVRDPKAYKHLPVSLRPNVALADAALARLSARARP